MSNVIRVVAAVVDAQKLTLWKEDGSTHLIMQGNPQLQEVLTLIMPVLTDGGVAEVELDSTTAGKYAEFETKVNGLVKFFRVAKEKLDAFFAEQDCEEVSPPVPEVRLGKVPTNNMSVTSVTVGKRAGVDAPVPAATKLSKAVDEIMSHATPASSEGFKQPSEDSTDTVIAVMGGKVIPDVEKLHPQIENSLEEGNKTIGMENFLRRLSNVIGNRRHSVQDLLKFLERGDLPIADDGSIIIYKILRKRGDCYVDCHTRTVPQKVGSFVHMDEKMVDADRRNDCSNGLHVARRGYLGNFSGDVCVIGKVAPEDVIAVPQYDANKMRVCGYHIIAELSPEAFKSLQQNKAMTGNAEGQLLLGKVMAGDHIGILEKVKIVDQKKTPESVVVTPVVAAKTTGKQKVVRKVKAIADPKPECKLAAPKVNAKAVSDAIVAARTSGKSARVIHAEGLLDKFNNAKTREDRYTAALELVEFKKKAKVSWDTLCVSAADVEAVTNETARCVASEAAPEPSKKAKPVKVAAPKKAAYKPVAIGSRVDKMRALLAKVEKGNKPAAAELLVLQKKAKKSWSALGFPSNTGDLCQQIVNVSKKSK